MGLKELQEVDFDVRGIEDLQSSLRHLDFGEDSFNVIEKAKISNSIS